jgi:hypothetical protein
VGGLPIATTVGRRRRRTGQAHRRPEPPAFWLPGQEVTRQNFDAFWSLDVCKANGDSCEAGFECCEGTCRVDNGKKSCGTRLGCAQDGDTCAADKDCCGGASCVGGVCSVLVK